MADPIVARVQAEECGGNVLERLRLHLDEREGQIFVDRIVRQIGRRTRHSSDCNVPERPNVPLQVPFNRVATSLEHLSEFSMARVNHATGGSNMRAGFALSV